MGNLYLWSTQGSDFGPVLGILNLGLGVALAPFVAMSTTVTEGGIRVCRGWFTKRYTWDAITNVDVVGSRHEPVRIYTDTADGAQLPGVPHGDGEALRAFWGSGTATNGTVSGV